MINVDAVLPLSKRLLDQAISSQVRLAESLERAGRWDEARFAWLEAAALVERGPDQTECLDHFDHCMAQLGDPNPSPRALPVPRPFQHGPDREACAGPGRTHRRPRSSTRWPR